MKLAEMSQPLKAACEAIYREFDGYWPSDSECARLQCAIDAVLGSVEVSGSTEGASE